MPNLLPIPEHPLTSNDPAMETQQGQNIAFGNQYADSLGSFMFEGSTPTFEHGQSRRLFEQLPQVLKENRPTPQNSHLMSSLTEEHVKTFPIVYGRKAWLKAFSRPLKSYRNFHKLRRLLPSPSAGYSFPIARCCKHPQSARIRHM